MSTPQDLQDPLALDRQVSYSLVVAARSVTALYRPILDPLGLTHPSTSCSSRSGPAGPARSRT